MLITALRLPGIHLHAHVPGASPLPPPPSSETGWTSAQNLLLPPTVL
jgi:hypothetical protein